MLDRLEDERREAGRAVLRAQEQERGRIAQDLHDEVNQALTAILLRLSATIQDAPWGCGPSCRRPRSSSPRRWTSCSRSRASCARPRSTTTACSRRSPRRSPTSASARARRPASPPGELPQLSDEEQLVIFRVTQESLSNIAKHAGARDVDVELSFVGRTLLRVRDDGGGFDRASAARTGGRVRGLAGRPRPQRHARARAARRGHFWFGAVVAPASAVDAPSLFDTCAIDV